MCATEGTLDQCGGGVIALCMSEELGGGEEDAFGFGHCGLATNVHFQAKSAEVVKDEVHALFEVFS
jgi:hypothetical protein